jgi:hypothetical protein
MDLRDRDREPERQNGEAEIPALLLPQRAEALNCVVYCSRVHHVAPCDALRDPTFP